MARKQKYNVLGGVVAPADSSYTISSMSNPLLEKNKKPLDTSLPSMRFNEGVSNFNNFNPYTKGVAVNINPILPHDSYKLDNQAGSFTTDVKLNGKPAMSPILGYKMKGR
jgi:hypothetical protein